MKSPWAIMATWPNWASFRPSSSSTARRTSSTRDQTRPSSRHSIAASAGLGVLRPGFRYSGLRVTR